MSDANVMAESYSNGIHGLTSEDDTKPMCKFCGKKFAQSSYIKAHMRLHTGEKPFACTFCPKRFSDCSNWKKHERIHIRQMGLSVDKVEESKPMFLMQSFQPQKVKMENGVGFSCKICGKTFANASSLTAHRRIHSGERPYRCQTCGKSFTQIGTLRTHERVHTGEKPYECKICGQSFAQNGSFRMHERRHMMEMLHKCPICPVKFSRWEDAKKHLSTHPEIATSTTFMESDILQVESGKPKQEKVEEETLPHIETFTSRADLLPAGFPFPHQLPPLLSAGPLHFPAALSLAGEISTPVSLFPSQFIQTGTVNIQSMLHDFKPAISLPVVTSPPTNQQQAYDNSDTNVVSTTTARDRKYSTDSYNSRTLSTPDAGCDSGNSKYEVDKTVSRADNSVIEEEIVTTQSVHKPPSDDSSFTSEHSDNTHSDEQQGISRQNLHSRLISSSTRKQRHPMRRYSGSGSMDPDTSTQPTTSVLSDDSDINELYGQHEEGNFDPRNYRCDHCHIIFEDCTLYLLHNGFHSHDTDPFKCVICKQVCRDRIEFNCHLTSHIK